MFHHGDARGEQDRVRRPRRRRSVSSMLTRRCRPGGARARRAAGPGGGQVRRAGAYAGCPKCRSQPVCSSTARPATSRRRTPRRRCRARAARRGGHDGAAGRRALEREPGQVGAVGVPVVRAVEVGAGVADHADPVDRELGARRVALARGLAGQVRGDRRRGQPRVGHEARADHVAQVHQAAPAAGSSERMPRRRARPSRRRRVNRGGPLRRSARFASSHAADEGETEVAHEQFADLGLVQVGLTAGRGGSPRACRSPPFTNSISASKWARNSVTRRLLRFVGHGCDARTRDRDGGERRARAAR